MVKNPSVHYAFKMFVNLVSSLASGPMTASAITSTPSTAFSPTKARPQLQKVERHHQKSDFVRQMSYLFRHMSIKVFSIFEVEVKFQKFEIILGIHKKKIKYTARSSKSLYLFPFQCLLEDTLKIFIDEFHFLKKTGF